MSPEEARGASLVIGLSLAALVALGAIGLALLLPLLRKLVDRADIFARTYREAVRDAERHYLWEREQAAAARQAEADALARQERDAAQAREDDELLRTAGDNARQNMILLATLSDLIKGPADAPEALTLPAREGWDMAVARMRARAKDGLQESRKKPTTQETP